MFGYGNSWDYLGIIIVVLFGTIIIFLVCRELICWYWKLNRIVSLLEEQNMLLSRLMRNNIKNTILNNSPSITEDTRNNDQREEELPELIA